MLQKLEFALDLSVDGGHVTAHHDQNSFYLMSVPEHPLWKGMDMKSSECVFCVTELEPGVYSAGLNFEHSISGYTQFKALRSYERLDTNGIPATYQPGSSMSDYFEHTVEVYGVADSIDQIKAHYKSLIESEARLVICATEMRRDEQPDSGGWRWNKWGAYIGIKEPSAEYLYDEPDIESVFVFHVYSVVPKLEPVIEATPDVV